MTPHTGPAFLYVRSSKYNHSSMSTHITDLHEVSKTDMENSSHNSFVLLSDGGPDFSPSSVLNHLFLFRLFKVLHLDMLSVSTYAARYSAFNPIEHLWSVMSNKLSGVVQLWKGKVNHHYNKQIFYHLNLFAKKSKYLTQP